VETIQAGSARVSVRVPLTEPDGKALDLTSMTACTFVFVTPTGGRVEKVGSLDGAANLGKVKYVSSAGDFDEVGRWEVQVQVVFDDGSDFYSAVGKFKVKANL
jgi:hypothetical protein